MPARDLAPLRCLLAVLAVHAGEPISRDRLMRMVWDDRPPAPATFGKYERWWRTALAPGGAVLETTPSGLCLRLPREAVDVHRFRDLARRAATATGPRQAAALATAALGLSEQTPLDGLPGWWASSTRATLEQERLDVAKVRFQAWSRAGEVTAERIDEYEAELGRHGPDDDAVVLLIRALRRAGNEPRAAHALRRHRERTERLGATVGTRLLRQARPVRSLRSGLPPQEAAGYQERSAWYGPDGSATRCWILSGDAGVGKTQLALRIAGRIEAERATDAVVWVDARSRQSIVAGYAEALRMVTGTAEAHAERAARAFLTWLGSGDADWLVVLDDVGDVHDLRGLWPPGTDGGTTIVTTRRRDSNLRGPHRTVVEVGEFTEDEARDYLTHKLAQESGVDAVIARLGRLPVMLSQVAAYMLDRGLTGGGFLERLRERGLTGVVPERSALPDGQSVRLAGVWRLSIDRADQLDPPGLARPVLRLMSALYPGGVPERLFGTAAVAAWLGRAATDVQDATRALERLSLVTRVHADGDRSVQAHALLLEITWTAQPAADRAAALRPAADGLLEIWPETERSAPVAALLRANARALIDHDSFELWTPAPHPLLGRLAHSLGESGDLAGVGEYLDRLLARASEGLGADHRFTLRTRHFAAYWKGQAGEHAEATRRHTALLADCRRVLGPDDPLTLKVRIYLARWCGQSGRPGDAVRDLHALVADLRRVLGPDDEDTLTARNDHAHFLGLDGHPGDAVRAFDALLADRRRILHPRHPHVFVAANDLAYWTLAAGDAAEALRLYEDLVPEIADTLGQHHPYALGGAANRARARGETGDATGAAAELAELAGKARGILGQQHPLTVRTAAYATEWAERAR
ncbi:BTAD domain-containing putative transcriptional regulator [Symbioplanes lichenis]|uniref:BTAD domain-containing putative transcriptional regulator n=1 Tax=Symbioplanes lichenis TaxID=1629072 RepID=UPI002739FA56|nr:BTAD domain-containing putative transcriptional regulator [Actinoplanes lichenis]